MVKSKISNVNYPEIKNNVFDEDIDYLASMYLMDLQDNDVVIALGQANYKYYKKNNIIFFPMYIVFTKNSNKMIGDQIGLFEVKENELPLIKHDSGEINIENLNDPLLYDFADRNYLQSYKATKKLLDLLENRFEEKDDEEKEEEEEKEEDDEKEEKDEENSVLLKEESKEDSFNDIKQYIYAEDDLWIQKFLKNKNFSLYDNEGGGDCLFMVIRDAFKSINKTKSVYEIRELLSKEANDELFQNYKQQYNDINSSLKEIKNDIKKLQKQNKLLLETFKQDNDFNKQKSLVEDGKKIKHLFEKKKSELRIQEDLYQEFKIMENIENLNDFKKIIKTCDFWADSWAISALERILNIKIVILSSDNWEQKDFNNILQCGMVTDPIISERKRFEPDYYILVDYSGIHYKLITYKNNKLFSFPTIPYSIKSLICKKCKEGEMGSFKIIPQFKVFCYDQNIEIPFDIEVLKEEPSSLYDPNTVFVYDINSNKKNFPGRANGETIENKETIRNYASLHNFENWRQKLDNDYFSLFTLDNLKWNSVTHYLEACKFKKSNKDFYILFSANSNSKISKNIDMAKAAGSKSGMFEKKIIRPSNINFNEEEYNKSKNNCLEKALYAKFNQNELLKEVLLQTKDAKLIKKSSGKMPSTSNILMLTRNKLKNLNLKKI